MNAETADTEAPPVEGQDERDQPHRDPLGLLGVFAVLVALLLPVAFAPNVFAVFWTPKAALTLLLAGVGLPYLVAGAARRDRASIAFLAFLVVATLSTAFAGRPALAVFGLYNHGVGLLFFTAVGGAWAIGRALSDHARVVLGWAIATSVVVNAAVAVAQALADLGDLQLPLSSGRSTGMLANPVHLGALMAAGVAWAAYRWTREGPSLAPAIVLTASAVGLQLSGSRFALGVAVVATLACAAHRPLTRGVVAVLVLVAGLGLGQVVSSASDIPTGTARASAFAASGSGIASRVEMWKASTSAVADHPILGAGPGQYRAASARYRTIEVARAEGPEQLFIDAHNVVVEILVTTGALGLVALGAWAVLAVWGSRGPLLALALGGLGLTLVQPMTVMTVPVCALALGAAWRGADRPVLRSRLVAAPVALGVLAAGMGAVLVVGDHALLAAELDFTFDDGERADDVLPPWSEPAAMLAKLNLFQSVIRTPDDPEFARRSVEWRREATRRDPTDPVAWLELAELRFSLEDLDGAEESFTRALQANPQSARGMLGLGEVATARDDHRAALRWYRSALARSTNANNRAFLERRIERAERALES